MNISNMDISFFLYLSIHFYRGECMIIEEMKSDSTLIKIDDSYIGTKQTDKEITEILVGMIINKISEYSY